MPTTQKSTSLLKFIPPRLTEGQEWYISYYAIYPATGKLRRVKIKLNRIKTISQRRLIGRQLISDITKKLLAGWNPFVESEAPKSFHFIFNVFDTFLKVHSKESENSTNRTYKSYIKILKEYLLRNNYDNKMYVSHFDRRIASDIMIEIKENDNYSFQTYNNYLKFYKALFNWMMQFNYITLNPFDHIKRIPTKMLKKIRTTLTNEEREQLKNYLIAQNNNNYLVMCLLCYYCFLRPNEIVQLRVKDIDVKKQVIYISEDIAKNDQNSIRTIPDAMMEYVLKLKLNFPPDFYLFSLRPRFYFAPGKIPAEGKLIGRYWSDFIRPALGFPMSKQFYSLKDTGITNMLGDGVAVNFVQGQADHSSMSITSIYAKKRNAAAQEDIRTKSKSFCEEKATSK